MRRSKNDYREENILSVLSNEPKGVKARARCVIVEYTALSVLSNEPKGVKVAGLGWSRCSRFPFSALERAEGGEGIVRVTISILGTIPFSALERAEGGEGWPLYVRPRPA